MNINVLQSDIDLSVPGSADNNCVAVALKRIKARQDIRAYAYLGYVRIGGREYVMDDYARNRLIIHGAGLTIAPFEFDLK